MKKRLILLLALTGIAAINANADLVLSEEFNYPDGPLVGAPGSPWSSHSGTAGQMQVVSGQVEVRRNQSEDVNALLSGQPYLTGLGTVFYSSFDVTFTELPTLTGTYFGHFKNAASGFRGRVWASTTNAADGSFRLGIVNSSNGDAASGQFPMDLSLNTTYNVVTRLDQDTGINTIWIDPTMETDTSVSAVDDPISLIDVTSYAFRQASGEGMMLIDSLRVGTSFNDVAGPDSPPSISSIPSQNVAADSSTGPIPFIVGDDNTPVGSLTVSAGSSNPTLVPTNNIVLGGADENRTVTITPAAGQQGTAVIDISVTDELPQTTTTTFVLTVGAPSISDIANQITPTNVSLGPIAFTVSDSETDAGSLTLSFQSSDTNVIPESGLVFVGSGGDRTLTITPASGVSGLSTITVTVSDGVLEASDSFNVTVFPLLGLVFSDDFDRADGPLVVFPGTWISHSGNPQEVEITNNRIVLTGAESEDVSAQLPGFPFPPQDGYVFHASFTVNVQELPSSSGSYFAHFKDESFAFRGRIFASTANAASGTYRIGLANSGGGQSIQFPQDLATNVTHMIVVRYNVSTGETRLWVDPSAETSTNIDATDNAVTMTLESFAFRQNTGIGTMFIDDLKVGTLLSDVLDSVAPTPIPLNIELSGGDVVLSWSDSRFNLQAAPDVTGTYTNVNGATSPHNYTIGDGQLFFRLEAP